MNELLTVTEELADRISKVARIFAQADSTLRGTDIQVSVENHGNDVPAWSTDTEIFFNLRTMDANDFLTPEGIIALYGLNYHELAHLLYTPSSETTMRKQLTLNPRLRNAWNILEDQRIERLLCGRYLACAPYLAAVFMRYIFDNQSRSGRIFPLSVGRRHLPQKIRDLLRRDFNHPQHIDEIESIVNAYLKIRNYRDDAKALELVERFAKVLDLMMPPPDFNKHDMRPIVTSAGSASAEQTEKDSKAADQAEADGELHR